jgi:hypothetical protein
MEGFDERNHSSCRTGRWTRPAAARHAKLGHTGAVFFDFNGNTAGGNPNDLFNGTFLGVGNTACIAVVAVATLPPSRKDHEDRCAPKVTRVMGPPPLVDNFRVRREAPSTTNVYLTTYPWKPKVMSPV